MILHAIAGLARGTMSMFAEMPNEPRPMPHNARDYAFNIKLHNYINAYYQIRDCLGYNPKRVLIVGMGVGLEPILLKEKYGLDISTIDIDPGFKPDYEGSVHKMDMFSDGEFDVSIASHVLEHMPFSFFEPSIQELARVSKHSLIYLPYGGMHFELKLTVAQFDKEFNLRLWKPPLRKIDGEQRILCKGEHCWECGYRGFSANRIKRIMSRYFQIDKAYHNADWKYSLNFCLTSKWAR